jgi:hypothetical protein
MLRIRLDEKLANQNEEVVASPLLAVQRPKLSVGSLIP